MPTISPNDFFNEISSQSIETFPEAEDDPYANPPKNLGEEDGEEETLIALEDLLGYFPNLKVQKPEPQKPESPKPAKGHRKKRKEYDTLNIPFATFVELRHWRDALAATDPDRKWTYEAVLVEMMKALAAKNEKAYAKYKEMTTVQDTQRPLQERTAAMRKSSLKKKKKNLGYVLLKVGGDTPPCCLKIYRGKKEWKYGKEVQFPDYCHVPMHIPYNKDYPLLKAGKNIPLDKLLEHPGAERHQYLRPVTVGTVEIREQGETKTFKLRRSLVTGKEYIVKGKKKQKLDEVKAADTKNKVKIQYDLEEGIEPPAPDSEREPRDL